MKPRHFVHFSQLTITARMLYTGVLCVLGAGYLAAMVFVFISHAGRDGKPA
ncbi:MAG: hypothetical protein HY846_07510, partial [Nitrosomonadales bacterium]|nr:hypothetical protein [Nitrosomonadales bacterium]